MSANPYAVRGQHMPGEFADWNRSVRRARFAHEQVKADHALPFGCDACRRGTAYETGEEGWVVTVGLLLCANRKTLVTTRRLIARAIAAREAARSEVKR